MTASTTGSGSLRRPCKQHMVTVWERQENQKQGEREVDGQRDQLGGVTQVLQGSIWSQCRNSRMIRATSGLTWG